MGNPSIPGFKDTKVVTIQEVNENDFKFADMKSATNEDESAT